MKKRILNSLLLVTSLLGYLEWGVDKHSFLFQTEYEILFGEGFKLENFIHPFILLPLFGQLLIAVSLFQKTPSKKLSIFGIIFLSVIMLMILLVGCLSGNFLIILSTIPFITTSVLVISEHRKR